MRWTLSNRFDARALPLADRHYNRQKPGTPQFVPPSSNVVLISGDPVSALWVSIRQKYVKHAWPGAWCCSLFRNEGPCFACWFDLPNACRVHGLAVPCVLCVIARCALAEGTAVPMPLVPVEPRLR